MSSKSFILQKKRDESFRKAHVKKAKSFPGSNVEYCRQDRLQSFPHSKEYKRKLSYVKTLKSSTKKFFIFKKIEIFSNKNEFRVNIFTREKGLSGFFKGAFLK